MNETPAVCEICGHRQAIFFCNDCGAAVCLQCAVIYADIYSDTDEGRPLVLCVNCNGEANSDD